jgi:hypothetical protein
MEKEFIPYEQALALKELGFDKRCFGYYVTEDYYSEKEGDFETVDVINGYCGYTNYDSLKLTKHRMLAPLYQQAFRWFREKYLLNYSLKRCHKKQDYSYIFEVYNPFLQTKYTSEQYETYEEAKLECLNKLIKIVKNENIRKST